jgi:FtsP/CotA-like multicopper oxidase with cupredoxin domain
MNRRPAARTTTLLLAVAALGAATLTGCASGSSSAAPASTTASAPAATTSTAATPSASTASETPAQTPTPTPTAEGQLVEITVAKGKVTGPKGRVKVKKGSTVTLRVTSDVADEIHLHGYDKHADVEKGGTADLTFKATLAGVFEVELEEKALQLVQLQVQ